MKRATDITGYERKDGKFGIRNHVLVLPTVSCVNGVVRRISREVPEAVCAPHAYGCGRGGPRDLTILFRILSGLVHHPNVGGVVLIGLGCEVSNTKSLLSLIKDAGKPVKVFNVQEDGGSLKTAEKGISAARQILSEVSGQRRVALPWDKLLVAMECGGSDAMSGVTANVAMGTVSDWLVENGASVIFGENTEMIGTTHVLARRAKTLEVAKQIEEMIERAEKLTREVMGDLASLVISPGNMDGGMSTIAEKSMGCIFKGGTSAINQVVDYGEVPSEHGLILQDGPGYDGDSMTGLAASGSQLMFFSTGRGTPAGFPVLPVVKVASNTRIYDAMKDDMDINAGSLVEGQSLNGLRAEMIDLMIRVINGEKTKAEANGMEVFTLMTVHPPF
ncbi:MAG TPA: UxaA family hydrolase [Thermodesulfobacteriota bacterium]|nr:UxaA family hydrolase [Thermodesulfobacteriota bacterium]